MNDLEQALAGSDADLDFYLANTTTEQFREDIKNLMSHNQVAAFKKKIIALIEAI